jgi:hypothetical protein
MNHASDESRRLANQDFEQSLHDLESLFVSQVQNPPEPQTKPSLPEDDWNWTDQELDENFSEGAIAPEEAS